jgi:uncharacterized protein YggE
MIKLLVVAVLLLPLRSVAARADEGALRTISTSGSAEVKVTPDEVEITLGIETRDKNLMPAKKQNSERQQRLMAALAKHKVPPKSIQSDFITIEPEYERNDERTLVGYLVRRSVAVLLTDPSHFDELLTDVLQAGVNHVHNIQFRTTQLRKHRDRARIMAIQAARDKALALAKELGQKVGRPRTIHEGSGSTGRWGAGWGSRYGQSMQNQMVQSAGDGDSPESSGLSLGQISVTASVSVTFELE